MFQKFIVVYVQRGGALMSLAYHESRCESLRAVRTVVYGSLCWLVMAASSQAQAQTRTLFGNSGSSGTSSGTSNRSLFGSTAQGAATGTQAGGNLAGQAAGASSAMAGFGRTTSTGEAAGFVGGFQTQNLTAPQAGNRSNRNTTTANLRNFQSRQRGFQQQQGGNVTAASRRSFQAGFRVGFAVPVSQLGGVTTRLTPRMADPRAFGLSAINVRQEGSTVVLEGSVASEHQRLLAETIARLEPGVSAVRNSLSIVEPSTAEEGTPVLP